MCVRLILWLKQSSDNSYHLGFSQTYLPNANFCGFYSVSLWNSFAYCKTLQIELPYVTDILRVKCQLFTYVFFIFYILLTVHHVMVLGKWPTWRTILFYVFIFIFNSLHVSSTSCSSSGETNCVNTTSGSCHSVSVDWQLPEVVLTQFVSPDDEHDVLETWTELRIKINT